jgi:hypothetical protein
MTTMRTYRCDLCRDPISENEGVGVYWSGGTSIQFKLLRDAERHLCNACIRGVLTEGAILKLTSTDGKI